MSRELKRITIRYDHEAYIRLGRVRTRWARINYSLTAPNEVRSVDLFLSVYFSLSLSLSLRLGLSE